MVEVVRAMEGAWCCLASLHLAPLPMGGLSPKLLGTQVMSPKCRFQSGYHINIPEYSAGWWSIVWCIA